VGAAVVTSLGGTTHRLAAAVLLLAVLPGCGGASSAGDRSESPEPRVLRMGSPSFDPDSEYTPAVAAFTDRVAELSGGRLTVELVFGPDDESEYWAYLPEGEQQVVRALAAGELDLAWAATRVFDTLGAPAFAALQAPMVIDSYALQDVVLRSDVPATLLPELDAVGVSGLALLAGGLRHPVGVAGPFLGPEDYAGTSFQHYRSEVQASSVQALGATPTDVVSSARDDGLASGEIAGHEHSLNTYVIRHQADVARYVTANVVLWPEMVALLAAPGLELVDQERSWLEQAAADAAAQSVALADVDDERAVAACGQGALLATASEGQLAALAAAVQPVLDSLRRDATTAAVLQEVEQLKRSVTASPLAVPTGCALP
jgi:TRAP-type transport system periplasmic protein